MEAKVVAPSKISSYAFGINPFFYKNPEKISKRIILFLRSLARFYERVEYPSVGIRIGACSNGFCSCQMSGLLSWLVHFLSVPFAINKDLNKLC